MKKTLLATTLLVATTGLAVAESHSGVTLSGSGRFGLVYGELGPFSSTEVHTRLRFNIDAKTETDGGVTFGGRIRMQHVNGDVSDNDDWSGDYLGGARLNAAMLYMEASGFRVEVGNANGAYDSAGLMYNCEIGLTDSCFGDPAGSYAGYSSGPYGLSYSGQDPMGLFASYTMGDLTARISYHDADQNDGADNDTETSISVDWSSNGFSVSAAATDRPSGYGLTYIGAAYAIGDSTNVGINFFGGDINRIVTLYGNHTMASGLTVAGYVSDWEGVSDTAIGIGASYPLGGGASLKGAYHTWSSDVAYADFGVTFSF